ncbi:hypothetical protein D3C87_1511630 [compost metagenome]
MRLSVVFILLASCCALAQADESRKSELAHRLAKVLDFGKQWSNFETECAQTTGSPWDPDAFYRANPAAFGSITPRSAYWPRIQEAYRKYQLTVCGELSSGKFDPLVAKELEGQMTEAELAASINFFQSAAGVSFRRANDKASETARRLLGQRVGVDSPGYVTMQKALNDIAIEYQRAPR